MFLEKIQAEKFMSYERLECDLMDRPSGLTLIEGRNLDDGDSNGAGKSTPWDVVSWVLFGETVRGLDGDQIVHRLYKKDCFGRVKLSRGSETFEVTRYRKHTGKDAAGALFGNRLIVEWFPDLDGSGAAPDETIELGSIDATEKWLSDALGFDFDLLRCTVLFAQGETFNFVNETDKKQKEILSKIKRLDVLKGLKNARSRLSDLESKRSETSRKIEVLKSHLIDDVKTLYATEITEHDDEKVASLRGIASAVKNLETERDGLNAELISPEMFERAKTTLKGKIEEIEARVAEMQRKLCRPREGSLAVVKARLKRIGTLADPTCPTCDQPVDAETLRAEQDELIKKGSAIQAAIQKIETACNKLLGEGLEFKQRLQTAQDKEHEQKRMRDRLKRIEPEIAQWETERQRVVDRVNPWIAKKSEAIAKQKQIKAKIKELAADLAPLVDDEPYLRFWETGFSDKGLKSFVFDTLCATLTERTNHYLGILSGGAVSVSFDTQTKLKSGEMREKFECLVISDGETVPYCAYSGGEKTRISLAVDMSLADLMSDHYGTHFNVVVFDEQDTYLDRQGRQFYLQLLKERAKTQRVFVVAHDAEFKGLFDHAWIAEKKDGVSRLIT